jgi:hypothetical protein
VCYKSCRLWLCSDTLDQAENDCCDQTLLRIFCIVSKEAKTVYKIATRAWNVVCAPDVFAWYFSFMLLNVGQLLYILYQVTKRGNRVAPLGQAPALLANIIILGANKNNNSLSLPPLSPSLYPSLFLSLSFSISLSLSLTGEEGVRTLFTGQRERDKERERVRKRERELHEHASLSLSDRWQHTRTLSFPHSVSQHA